VHEVGLLAELDAFAETLRARSLFERGTTVVVSRAPGRLDVMGGIADYSGSLVLQRPIAEGTFAAVQLIDHPVLEIVSIRSPADRKAGYHERAPCTIPLDILAPGGTPVSYDTARRLFEGTTSHWVSYIAGAFLVLARERGLQIRLKPDTTNGARQVRLKPDTTHGARIVVSSDVPEGKGVSSSAAVETASMHAVAAVFGIELEARDLALLCQKSENLVSGAPCGVMDQMTCVFGAQDRLLALLCQPAELQPAVPIPDDIEFWGLDSGERHTVGGSDYGAVRAGAFIGLRILSEHAGVPLDYLANIAPDEFERRFARDLPEEIAGDDFIARYGGTTDSVTSIERGQRYRVKAPAMHPIYERRRAERFRQLLLEGTGEDRRVCLGTLMYESHASYGACGLGSPGTDRLVELVRAEGTSNGLYGARITGGGSGGTVAVVGRKDASGAIARIAAAYERATGYRPHVFSGSSPGVAEFGARSIRL
jgi:L-arabinokinase